MMTVIWMLDENWKSYGHMSGILLESFVHTEDEMFIYILYPMFFLFCTFKNILNYIVVMCSIIKIVNMFKCMFVFCGIRRVCTVNMNVESIS